MPEWEVVVPDTMGGEITVFRSHDKAEAQRVKASWSKDAAFPRVTLRKRKDDLL